MSGIIRMAPPDGFTLYDLVSYNNRRNQANGQEGKDGVQLELWLRRRTWPSTRSALAAHSTSKKLFCFTDVVRRYTSLGRPVDILGYETASVFKGNYAKVETRSIVVLQAKRD